MQPASAPRGGHERMDVRGAAHRRRVAERLRHRGDRLDHDGIARAFAWGQLAGGQRRDREAGRAPGAEILRRERRTHRVAQVAVDHAGVDRMAFARLVDILEQRLARQALAAPQQPDEAIVVDAQVLHPPALAAEAKPRGATAFPAGMPRTQGGQPVRAVAAQVLAIADAREGAIEQARHQRAHARARHALQRKVAAQPAAQGRQVFAEFAHAAELVAVTQAAPVRMVAILLAAARIATGGLQVAARIGTDPDIAPRRRYRELADALQRRRILDPPAVMVAIDETAPRAMPRMAV